VTLNDVAKYSITQSGARSLCGSWASCSFDRKNANWVSDRSLV